MIKCRSGPRRGVVTLLAGLREPGLHVVRIRRVVEIGLVAGNARRGVRQVIGSTRAERRVMALGALQRRVRPCQRESSRGVIKRTARPIRGVVTLLAGLREAGLHVIRIRGVVEIGLVAGNARRRVRQVIGTARAESRVVALCALQRCVRPRKRKTCR